MVHLSPEPPRWRRGNIVAGALLTLLGVAVLVVSVVALRQPDGHAAAAGTPVVTRTTTLSPSPRSSSGSAASSDTAAAPSGSAQGSSSADPSGSAPGSSSAGPSGNPKAVPVVVLNNTTTTGLAAQAAATFRSGGWTVTSFGNYSNNILSTCAYYDPSVAGAQDAATALMQQFPAIKRTKVKFDGLPAGPVVVVLTPDYS